jgi:hypothetical protein
MPMRIREDVSRVLFQPDQEEITMPDKIIKYLNIYPDYPCCAVYDTEKQAAEGKE